MYGDKEILLEQILEAIQRQTTVMADYSIELKRIHGGINRIESRLREMNRNCIEKCSIMERKHNGPYSIDR